MDSQNLHKTYLVFNFGFKNVLTSLAELILNFT